MFSSLRTSPLAQRTLGALDLARSFLLLEDDVSVDWEVDRNEHFEPVHPHRVPLRERQFARRPGTPVPARNECISPTFYGQPIARGGNASRHAVGGEPRARRRPRVAVATPAPPEPTAGGAAAVARPRTGGSVR